MQPQSVQQCPPIPSNPPAPEAAQDTGAVARAALRSGSAPGLTLTVERNEKGELVLSKKQLDLLEKHLPDDAHLRLYKKKTGEFELRAKWCHEGLLGWGRAGKLKGARNLLARSIDEHHGKYLPEYLPADGVTGRDLRKVLALARQKLIPQSYLATLGSPQFKPEDAVLGSALFHPALPQLCSIDRFRRVVGQQGVPG